MDCIGDKHGWLQVVAEGDLHAIMKKAKKFKAQDKIYLELLIIKDVLHCIMLVGCINLFQLYDT